MGMGLGTMKEGMLKVEGGRIWFRVTGDGGIPLIVLHGGPGATHDYLDNLEALSNERTVVLYDQLGSGRSERPADRGLWRAGRFVEELDALIRHLGFGRFHLLGQSWGTMLALMYAQKYGRDGIASLVLSAPYLSSPLWEADQRRHVSALPEKERSAILECEARGDYTAPAYAEAMNVFYRRHVCRLPVWPENLDRTLQGMGLDVYNTMWGPSEFTLTGNMRDLDVTAFLPELQVPVLYTCGEFDEATPATTRHYSELTPGSLMTVFPGASHMHHLEEGSFIPLVRAFLSDHDA
ncbi:MAG: proline iminopeptidase-family hydrolase [Methanomassiliicoccales archaeon]